MYTTDTQEYKEYMKSEKWKAIAKKRMEIDGKTCQGCGSRGSGNNPLEVHHLSYSHLYAEETRIYEDLVTLCHVCHKNLHRIMERQTNQNGRRGWKDNPRIPQIHVFNIDGSIEYEQGGIEG